VDFIPPSRLSATAARHFCPFNSHAYLSCLTHLGEVDTRPSAPSAVLRRPIPGSPRFDGLGPWPYMWLERPQQIAELSEAHSDRVTLTAVTQPGFRPTGAATDAIYFKDHYLYDPSLGFPILSKRTREHQRRAEQVYTFDIPADPHERLAIVAVFEELKRRRGLAGGFFDFPRAHFERVAHLESAVFFRVSDANAAAGIACGVMFDGMIHLLHIAIPDDGLRKDASYMLMGEVLEFARERRLLLALGGLPNSAGEGVRRFKARWSNRRAPVHLLRLVNDGQPTRQ
jgi:hypothetical protein